MHASGRLGISSCHALERGAAQLVDQHSDVLGVIDRHRDQVHAALSECLLPGLFGGVEQLLPVGDAVAGEVADVPRYRRHANANDVTSASRGYAALRQLSRLLASTVLTARRKRTFATEG